MSFVNTMIVSAAQTCMTCQLERDDVSWQLIGSTLGLSKTQHASSQFAVIGCVKQLACWASAKQRVL